MKFTTPLKAAVISAGIIAGALSLALPDWVANHHCQQLIQSAMPCTEVVQPYDLLIEFEQGFE